jgi:NAD dependent epimerase/dehydratase family enzyme
MRNAEFARQLGASLGRPSWLPVPGVALRLALGDFADYLLHGRPAVPRALERAGYSFRHSKPFV